MSPARHSGRARSAGGRGFTYLGVMFLVALLTLTATLASVVWSTEQQRANERELVFAGRQFQAAIERYRSRAPGNISAAYPRELADLLRDTRAVQIERHLRRVYIDPMTHRAEWGLIRGADGGIVGVHSLSERKPMAGTLLAASLQVPDDAGPVVSYRDWRFIAPSAGAAAGPSTPASALRPGKRVGS